MEKVTDNFKDFPARMSDGRAFTDYTPNCLTTQKLSQKTDSYEFRQNLIKNGDQLLNQQRKMLTESYVCDTCNKAIVPTEMFVQSCQNGNCFIDKISENGFGIRQQ